MTLTEQLKQLLNAKKIRMVKSNIRSFKKGIVEIYTNRVKENALQKTDTIPNYSFVNITGNNVQLVDVTNLNLRYSISIEMAGTPIVI